MNLEEGKETPNKGNIKPLGKRGRPKKSKVSEMNSPISNASITKKITKKKLKRGRKKKIIKTNSKENDQEFSLNNESNL